MPSITVKWGTEKLTVDADLTDVPLTFKGQLFALTGVPPDRQKVMIKVGFFIIIYFLSRVVRWEMTTGMESL